MRRVKSGSVLLLFAGCTAIAAFGQTLRDPTQPPSFSGSVREGEARASEGPVLQSVILAGGRKLALIDGRTYTVGDKLGEARLLAISASEVTLHESGGNKILRLTPDAQKTSAAPSGGSTRTSRTPTRTKGQQ